MKKILVISTSFPRWEGDTIPMFVYNLSSCMKSKCVIHVLCPHADGAAKSEIMNEINVHRFVYAPANLEQFGAGISIMDVIKNNPFYLLLIPTFIFSALYNLIYLYNKNKYDVIHLHWIIPFGPFIGILRQFYKFRFIITVHGSDVFPFSRKNLLSFFINLLHKVFTVPNADKIIFTSDALRKSFVKKNPESPQNKIGLCSMGIDYSKFSISKQPRSSLRPARLAFVGRLVEVKGISYLIDAMRIIKDRNISFSLQIYGDGPLRISLERQAYALGISPDIFFNGFVGHDRLPDRLSDADIFIGASITTASGQAEGFGLVFLEAMASGLAVIASKTSGIADTIVDYENGILVDEKDASQIAQSIEVLVADNMLYKKIIENGRELAKRYDWAVISQYYLNVYGITQD